MEKFASDVNSKATVKLARAAKMLTQLLERSKPVGTFRMEVLDDLIRSLGDDLSGSVGNSVAQEYSSLGNALKDISPSLKGEVDSYANLVRKAHAYDSSFMEKLYSWLKLEGRPSAPSQFRESAMDNKIFDDITDLSKEQLRHISDRLQMLNPKGSINPIDQEAALRRITPAIKVRPSDLNESAARSHISEMLEKSQEETGLSGLIEPMKFKRGLFDL